MKTIFSERIWRIATLKGKKGLQECKTGCTLKADEKDSAIQLKQICRDKKGRIRAVIFLFGARIPYIFAMDDDLVITKCVNELAPKVFDDETGNKIKDDDSVLFE